jgi:hypothetical protein
MEHPGPGFVRRVVVSPHALPRIRVVALVVMATALAALLGTALVRAVTAEPALAPTLLGPSQAPPRQSAPPSAPALLQESTPPGPTVAPTTSVLPVSPAQGNPPADATRQPLEMVPTQSAIPSFQPGGNLRPPFASIPPQN